VVKRDIVVMGGSAGAVIALSEIVARLPADLPAAVFVALHVSPTSEEWLSAVLATSSLLPVLSPTAAQSIESGRIYIARPDHHLIVKDGRVLVNRGPHENLWRPAVDVLFRSAAVAYGNRVVAVLTSGELDDGTSGLQAVKACGGTTVVQDPEDALFPTMLRTALTNVAIDHSARLHDIPSLLERLLREPAGPAVPIPQDLRKQARFHIKSLASDTDEQIDRTLWAAIRMFEQRVNISRMLAEQERSHGRHRRAELYDARADESMAHAQRLRELHVAGASQT
jgi:two-component system, chemotaxis family, protein-glutamate methylesterase/glutaminase